MLIIFYWSAKNRSTHLWMISTCNMYNGRAVKLSWELVQKIYIICKYNCKFPQFPKESRWESCPSSSHFFLTWSFFLPSSCTQDKNWLWVGNTEELNFWKRRWSQKLRLQFIKAEGRHQHWRKWNKAKVLTEGHTQEAALCNLSLTEWKLANFSCCFYILVFRKNFQRQQKLFLHTIVS